MNLKCETRHILRGGIERIIKSGGGEGLYLERADSDVRPVSSRTDRFPSPESLTRSKAEKSRLPRCDGCFHKVLGSNGDGDRRYRVLTMDDGGGCRIPGGLLPYLPQLTRASQTDGQTAPIFGCNVCNKERGQMEHPSTRQLIFPSSRER